jgi:hypothetical protein
MPNKLLNPDLALFCGHQVHCWRVSLFPLLLVTAPIGDAEHDTFLVSL